MRERDPDLKVAVLLERYETTAPARPVGRPRKDEAHFTENARNTNITKSRSYTATYAVSRSKRDRPDLADKIVRRMGAISTRRIIGVLDDLTM